MKIIHGNIFDSSCDILACPVNTVGVMGAGLAKSFAKRYPWIVSQYKALCHDGLLLVGRPAILAGFPYREKDILLFPTKTDWKLPSRIEYVEDGLRFTTHLLSIRNGNHSVAMCALGAGLGGLDWGSVLSCISSWSETIPNEVEVFGPK